MTGGTGGGAGAGSGCGRVRVTGGFAVDGSPIVGAVVGGGTAREIQVLQLIAEGLVNREIGQQLYLSEETVKSHVRHLLAKLQARSRAHAVAVGFRRGLIA